MPPSDRSSLVSVPAVPTQTETATSPGGAPSGTAAVPRAAAGEGRPARSLGKDTGRTVLTYVHRTSITFGEGFTHDLGPPCASCNADEARCCAQDGCCGTCTHRARQGAPFPVPGRSLLPVEHGTERGYHQHRVRLEPPCQPCRSAHSLHNQRKRSA